MRNTIKLAAGLFAAVVLLALAGCGPGIGGRYPASGTVTLDGQPVHEGTIVFVPEEEGKIKAGGPIENGRYDIPAKFGLHPGEHKVEIRWLKPTGRKLMVDDVPQPVDERAEVVPAEYNTNTTLTATV
jgi:hypothetical protein